MILDLMTMEKPLVKELETLPSPQPPSPPVVSEPRIEEPPAVVVEEHQAEVPTVTEEPEENKEPIKVVQKNKGRCFSCRAKV